MNRRLVPRPTASRAFEATIRGVQRLAFWTAVVLPLVYLPLLSRPDVRLLVVVALVVVNVVCLLVGHEYSP